MTQTTDDWKLNMARILANLSRKLERQLQTVKDTRAEIEALEKLNTK